MLMAAIGMQAQSLLGTWKTTVDEEGQKKDYYLTFAQGTLNVKVLSPITDPEMGTIVVSAQMPYDYTRSGDLLVMKPKADELKMGIEKMEFTDKVNVALNQNPELKKTVEDEMAKAVMKGLEAFKDQFRIELSVFATMTIRKLTATELVLVDNEGTTTFVRVE